MKRRGGICESALFPPLAPLPLVWPLCPLDGPHRGNLSCRACGYYAEGTQSSGDTAQGESVLCTAFSGSSFHQEASDLPGILLLFPLPHWCWCGGPAACSLSGR